MLRFACTALLFAAAAYAPVASAQATTYVAPRNALGQPDLGGLWTNATRTMLEREASYGDRLAMTPEEAAKLSPDPDNRIMDVNGEFRTSFLVEPRTGRLPPLTAEANAARTARMAMSPRGAGLSRGDNPESMTLAERCLKDFGSSSGPPMMPLGYNNTYQIVQSPGHVAILVEMIHDTRIIPIAGSKDAATHRPAAIRQWMGDSVGWYEGDTLVVETTDFRPGQAFRGAPDTLKVIERFRRVTDRQILYSFEINDPKVFTAPIKAEVAMNATEGPLYEYACHEGNYSFANMLGGQRIMDIEMAKIVAEAKKKR